MDHSIINFQIDLFTYKLNFQNKNYIYNKNKKTQIFFLQNRTTKKLKKKKKNSSHVR